MVIELDTSTMSARGAGEKTYSAQLGQLVSIEFPPESGTAGFRLQNGSSIEAARPGVTITNGMVSIDYKTFFAGTITSMMVTVTKQPAIKM